MPEPIREHFNLGHAQHHGDVRAGERFIVTRRCVFFLAVHRGGYSAERTSHLPDFIGNDLIGKDCQHKRTARIDHYLHSTGLDSSHLIRTVPYRRCRAFAH